jgi:hypothetical protein
MELEVSLPYLQEPATAPVLSEMNTVHNLSSNLLNFHSNIIFNSTLRSP